MWEYREESLIYHLTKSNEKEYLSIGGRFLSTEKEYGKKIETFKVLFPKKKS